MNRSIEERVRRTLAELPDDVELVAAAKTRSPEEIEAALAGGVRIVGQNYVQEAEAAIDALGRDRARWHMIGHLQRNKVKAAVRLFDLIQTVDSLRLAQKIDSEAGVAERVMPILIEVNSASEPQKAGALPEDVLDLVSECARLPAVRVEGLMTMGPLTTDLGELRAAFRLTKELFDRIALANVDVRTLSMGMSDSYKLAIEEGANMVRIGTGLFGPR
jgi:pyridoxal phosphate enzyme (YggS family)